MTIRARAGYSRGGGYRTKAANYKISEKSGSRSKAVNIKHDSTVKGTVIAGESRSDWYKFKLSGKKSVSLTVKGATNDRLKIEVYSGLFSIIVLMPEEALYRGNYFLFPTYLQRKLIHLKIQQLVLASMIMLCVFLG